MKAKELITDLLDREMNEEVFIDTALNERV